MEHAQPRLPLLAMLLAIALYTAMDMLMKDASIAIGAYTASLLRSFLGFFLAVPLWLASRPRWPARAVLRVHAVRGAVSAGTAVTFFYGLVRLPMAEAIALSFIYPFIAMYLAAALLGESIRPRSVAASLLGLAGVAVIAVGRSGQPQAHPEALLGVAAVLLSAALYGWNLVLLRQQSLLARPAEVAVFQSGVMGVTLLVAAPFLLTWPSPDAVRAIAGGTVLGTAAMMLASWAYARAETQALVPLEFTAFLWSALAGWLYFGERVTGWTLAGMLLIGTGSYVAMRLRRGARPAIQDPASSV